MSNSILLLIHNIGYIFDSLLVVFFIGFVYIKDHKTPVNRMFMMALVVILIFLVSHLIGVNIADPNLSRTVLMFNTFILFLSCFVAHFVFIVIGQEKRQKPALIAFYVVASALFLFYWLFPNTFLLNSIPKLYFPDYYVAGNLDWIMRLFANVLVPIYFLVVMFFAYHKADPVLKNKMRYLFLGLFLGYSFGAAPLPLVFSSSPIFFGIYFDPVYSILFVPFFVIPFGYAILKYELFDIRVVAKRAFVYALFVAVVGFSVAMLNYANEVLLRSHPGFPQWILPIISSVIAVSIGFLVWNKLRESDALKSEFITVVTHKFRTPLTQIRWATESLSPSLSEDDKNNVVEIERASSQLVDLTNLLVQLSATDAVDYNYQMRPMRLDALVQDMKPEYERRAGLKGIAISFSGVSGKNVVVDEAQTRFVIQTLLDNAISYTPKDGTIAVGIREEGSARKKGMLVFSVTDSGIGLSKEEAGRIFEKFWRSSEARKADTEGMGIGLFMARHIAERQGGSLKTQSEGLGKGTTFFLRLPMESPKVS